MSRRPASAAAFAVVLLVVGQLAALEHVAATRHVTCQEHGEQLEAPTLTGTDDNCGHEHWVGVEGTEGSDHQDCAIARLLRQNADSSGAGPAGLVATIVTTPAEPPPLAVARTYDVLLVAPKTSPPA